MESCENILKTFSLSSKHRLFAFSYIFADPLLTVQPNRWNKKWEWKDLFTIWILRL